MPKDLRIIQLAGDLKCCVIIPTYNNAATLRGVIEDVIRYIDDVIVVNDGSTDNTNDVLRSFSNILVLSYLTNRGKGYALKQGFRLALEKGFRYAVTIDSDGQHKGSNIESFLQHVQQNPDCLIVGSRLLKQENMPEGNTFANKFSNFWFRLQTGVDLPDTQSGFRLYPLEKISPIHIFTTRYEAELELLVRASWRDVDIRPLAISVYYPPVNERITHFRPFMDFFRISILNTFLTIIAIFYEYPRRWIRHSGKR
jgi:glycosyltransferase involved in cell wall biosynthesis